MGGGVGGKGALGLSDFEGLESAETSYLRGTEKVTYLVTAAPDARVPNI